MCFPSLSTAPSRRRCISHSPPSPSCSRPSPPTPTKWSGLGYRTRGANTRALWTASQRLSSESRCYESCILDSLTLWSDMRVCGVCTRASPPILCTWCPTYAWSSSPTSTWSIPDTEWHSTDDISLPTKCDRLGFTYSILQILYIITFMYFHILYLWYWDNINKSFQLRLNLITTILSCGDNQMWLWLWFHNLKPVSANKSIFIKIIHNTF